MQNHRLSYRLKILLLLFQMYLLFQLVLYLVKLDNNNNNKSNQKNIQVINFRNKSQKKNELALLVFQTLKENNYNFLGYIHRERERKRMGGRSLGQVSNSYILNILQKHKVVVLLVICRLIFVFNFCIFVNSRSIRMQSLIVLFSST